MPRGQVNVSVGGGEEDAGLGCKAAVEEEEEEEEDPLGEDGRLPEAAVGPLGGGG